MGFLDGLKNLVDIGVAFTTPKRELSNAQVLEMQDKKHADLAAEMELIMEKETDELIKNKLKWRLESGIFEWDDLYRDKKK